MTTESDDKLHAHRAAAKVFATVHLAALCGDLIAMRDAGVLPEGSRLQELRHLCQWAGGAYAGPVAESYVQRAAMDAVIAAAPTFANGFAAGLQSAVDATRRVAASNTDFMMAQAEATVAEICLAVPHGSIETTDETAASGAPRP